MNNLIAERMAGLTGGPSKKYGRAPSLGSHSASVLTASLCELPVLKRTYELQATDIMSKKLLLVSIPRLQTALGRRSYRTG